MSKPARLDLILAQLSAEERDLILEHIDGGTSAAWIAQTLTKWGHPIGSTAIKECRYKRRAQTEEAA